MTRKRSEELPQKMERHPECHRILCHSSWTGWRPQSVCERVCLGEKVWVCDKVCVCVFSHVQQTPACRSASVHRYQFQASRPGWRRRRLLRRPDAGNGPRSFLDVNYIFLQECLRNVVDKPAYCRTFLCDLCFKLAILPQGLKLEHQMWTKTCCWQCQIGLSQSQQLEELFCHLHGTGQAAHSRREGALDKGERRAGVEGQGG